MGRELRAITVGITTEKPEIIAQTLGFPMYADEVVAEVQQVIHTALADWYKRRGSVLLACEPT